MSESEKAYTQFFEDLAYLRDHLTPLDLIDPRWTSEMNDLIDELERMIYEPNDMSIFPNVHKRILRKSRQYSNS